MEGDLLQGSEREFFDAILNLRADNIALQLSLKNLTVYLHRRYQKPVLVLLDEYDAPVQAAWDYGYYDSAIIFMRNYLSSVLKTPPILTSLSSRECFALLGKVSSFP